MWDKVRFLAAPLVALLLLSASASGQVTPGVIQETGAASAPAAPQLTATDVNAWLDGFMPTALSNADIVGAVVTVVRDGHEVAVPVAQVVVGDVVGLAAGSVIPADCRLLEADELLVDESSLTGESFPVEKRADAVWDIESARRAGLPRLTALIGRDAAAIARGEAL